jgi:hypothetical protein
MELKSIFPYEFRDGFTKLHKKIFFLIRVDKNGKKLDISYTFQEFEK